MTISKALLPRQHRILGNVKDPTGRIQPQPFGSGFEDFYNQANEPVPETRILKPRPISLRNPAVG